MLLLKILVALAALGLGIWLGLPGRQQSIEEIDRNMEHPLSESRKVKRHFTPLAWLQRQISTGGRPSGRRGFQLKRPDGR